MISPDEIPAQFSVDDLVSAATMINHPDTNNLKRSRRQLLRTRKAIIAVLLGPETIVSDAVWIEHREAIKQVLIKKFPTLNQILDTLYTFRTPAEGGPIIEKDPNQIRILYARAK